MLTLDLSESLVVESKRIRCQLGAIIEHMVALVLGGGTKL